ncbi:hypothetical protein [Candidatus Berkiella aquae]|nr:hypothetical protein [Candidatus Berkiella aquae]MCS5710820.1 hypothetical protein [Candidatus Berkiella aquae]
MYVAEHQKITQRRHLKRNKAKLPINVPGEPILEIEPIHHFQSNRVAYEENECDVLFQDGMYFNFSINAESARDTEADNMTVVTESSIRVISPK